MKNSSSSNNNQLRPSPMGNIWGWKFSAFSFILIAVLAYVAFVIGEGPGAVKRVEPDTAKVINNTDTALLQKPDDTLQKKPDSIFNKQELK